MSVISLTKIFFSALTVKVEEFFVRGGIFSSSFRWNFVCEIGGEHEVNYDSWNLRWSG